MTCESESFEKKISVKGGTMNQEYWHINEDDFRKIMDNFGPKYKYEL